MRVLRRSSSHRAERPPGHGWSSDNKPAIWKPVRTVRFRTVRLFTGTAPELIIPGFSAADHPRSVWRTLNPQTHNTHDCSHLQPLTLACWSAQGQSAAAAARSTRQLRCAPPQLAAPVGRHHVGRALPKSIRAHARGVGETDGAPHPQRLALLNWAASQTERLSAIDGWMTRPCWLPRTRAAGWAFAHVGARSIRLCDVYLSVAEKLRRLKSLC